MPRSQSEFRLQCAVADLLRWSARPGLYWSHIPNGEARSVITGARLKRMGVRAGAPDLLLIWEGRPIGIELKAGKGKQTQSQIETERDWTMAGGLYRVCNGFEEAESYLRALGVLTERERRPYQQRMAV